MAHRRLLRLLNFLERRRFVGVAALFAVASLGLVLLARIWIDVELAWLMGVLFFLIAVQIESFRRLSGRLAKLSQEARTAHRDAQRVLWLAVATAPRVPLPPLGGYALRPAGAILLVELLHRHRPRRVVELGSGVSSLLTGYTLERFGSGHLVSLEHDVDFARETAFRLASHGLDATVDLRHAPLREIVLEEHAGPWYDTACLDDLQGIDLLLVDGPPGAKGPQSRYPALPLLHDRLANGARIFVDDADREAEQTMVERWLQEFPDLSIETRDLEAGVVVLVQGES